MEPNLKYNVDSDNFYKYNELQGIQPLSSYVNNNDFFRQSKICFPIINYKFNNNSNLINFGTYGDYYNIKNLSNIDLLDIEPSETITLIFTDGNTSKYLITGYDRLNYLNSESVDITLKYGDTLHIINNSSEPISIKEIIDGSFSEVIRQQSGENFLKWTPSNSNVQYMYESITNSSNWGNIKFNSNSNNILLKNNNNLILNREFDIINNLTFSIWLKIDINIQNDYFNAITNKNLNFFTINNNLIELNIRERYKTFQFNLKNQDNVNLIFENTIDRESIINDNNTDIILYEGDSLVIHSEFNDNKDLFQIKDESEQIVNNINNTGSFGIPSIGRSITWNLPIGNYKYYKNIGSEIVINQVFQDLTLNNWNKTLDHQMVKFNNNTMIIFGGWGANSDLVDQNIFHVITINNDGTRKETSQKITELSTDTHNYYKTIIIDNSLYIHVNVMNTVPDRIFKITFNGDPHDFDYTVKTYSIDSNHIPRRYSHGFFNIDNDFYLFGGYHAGPFNNWLSNDLYRINLNDDETYTYSKLELDDTSDYITPRYYFGISKINNNIYILGGYANKNSDDPEPEEGYTNDNFSNEIFKLTINNNTYHSTLIRYNGYKQDLQMQEPHCLTLNNDIFIIGYNKHHSTLIHNYNNTLNNKIYKLTINPDTDELTVKILIDNMYETIGYHVRYITFVNINNNIYGYLQSMTDTSLLDKRFIKIEINNSLGTINVKDNTDIIFNINNTLDFDTSNNSTIINYKTFIFDVNADGMNAYTFNEVKDRRNTISGNNPDITIYTGDTCIFNNISDGHIIAIKDSNEQVIETESNKSLTYKFTEIGTYTYYCTAGHQSMIGNISVEQNKDFLNNIILNYNQNIINVYNNGLECSNIELVNENKINEITFSSNFYFKDFRLYDTSDINIENISDIDNIKYIKKIKGSILYNENEKNHHIDRYINYNYIFPDIINTESNISITFWLFKTVSENSIIKINNINIGYKTNRIYFNYNNDVDIYNNKLLLNQKWHFIALTIKTNQIKLYVDNYPYNGFICNNLDISTISIENKLNENDRIEDLLISKELDNYLILNEYISKLNNIYQDSVYYNKTILNSQFESSIDITPNIGYGTPYSYDWTKIDNYYLRIKEPLKLFKTFFNNFELAFIYWKKIETNKKTDDLVINDNLLITTNVDRTMNCYMNFVEEQDFNLKINEPLDLDKWYMVVANIGINNDHLSLSFGIYDDSIDYSKRTTSVIQPLGRHKSAINLLTNSSNINTKIILGSNLDYYSDFRIYNKFITQQDIFKLNILDQEITSNLYKSEQIGTSQLINNINKQVISNSIEFNTDMINIFNDFTMTVSFWKKINKLTNEKDFSIISYNNNILKEYVSFNGYKLEIYNSDYNYETPEKNIDIEFDKWYNYTFSIKYVNQILETGIYIFDIDNCNIINDYYTDTNFIPFSNLIEPTDILIGKNINEIDLNIDKSIDNVKIFSRWLTHLDIELIIQNDLNILNQNKHNLFDLIVWYRMQDFRDGLFNELIYDNSGNNKHLIKQNTYQPIFYSDPVISNILPIELVPIISNIKKIPIYPTISNFDRIPIYPIISNIDKIPIYPIISNINKIPIYPIISNINTDNSRELNNEIKSTFLKDDTYYIKFNYDLNLLGYTIKFPEEYSNFDINLLIVNSSNSTPNIRGELIYCNLSLNSDTEYDINLGNINEDSSFNNIIAKSGNLYESRPFEISFSQLNFPIVFNTNNIIYGKSHTNEGESLYKIFPDSNLGNYKDSEINFANIDGNYIYDYNLNVELLTSGYNNYGQLGLGDTTNRTTSTKIEHYQENNDSGTLFPLDNVNIKQFIKNKELTALLDNEGNVYSCGRNYYGDLGLGDTTNRNILTKIDKFQDINEETIEKPIIIFITIHDRNIFFLDNEGNVYVCGEHFNYKYKTGLGDSTNTNKYRPTRIDEFQDIDNNTIEKPFIIGISSSTHYNNSVTLIGNNGSVYTFGYEYLGLEDNSTYSENKPTRMDNFQDENKNVIDKPFITKSANGSSTTFLLDNEGNVYSYGYNDNNLGISNTSIGQRVYIPTRIEEFKDSTGVIPAVKILNIYASVGICCLLDYEGNVYSFGYNWGGQLGHGDINAGKNYPTKIETYHDNNGNVINDFIKISQISLAGYYDETGSITFLDTNGNIYVTGKNFRYEFGNGTLDTQQYSTPTKLDVFSNIISIDHGMYLKLTDLIPKYTSSDITGTVIIKYTSKYTTIKNSINNELKPILINNDEHYIQFNYDLNLSGYTIEFPEEYSNFNVDLLVVGGGGGGGYGSILNGAGGGSVGGILYGSNLELHKNREYKITIGNGGLGGIDGEDSKFYLDDANFALARGGGKGGSYNSPPGQGGGGSGNYPEGGSINIYNSNIGDFSTLNSYQNKGNDAFLPVRYTVFDFTGSYNIDNLIPVNGRVSVKRYRFDDSERVIISTGNWNEEQPGIEASQHYFEWDTDDYLIKKPSRVQDHFTCWGFLLDDPISYNLGGTQYDKHFYLCRTNTKIELTTIAFLTRLKKMKHFKIFGTNFDTSDITFDNIATNNWVELVEIDMKTTNHLLSFNKNNIYNHNDYKYTYENINTHFYTYNWTNTTDGFNTFLFMVFDNSSSTVNVDEIAFRGKIIDGSIGGDGSSSDLIYLTSSLNFEGGIGKSNIDTTSVTNADDNTGNGGSGNGGKGGSGTVIIKYIPKYNYIFNSINNELKPIFIDNDDYYIQFNYDSNFLGGYNIKFPEEYSNFDINLLIVSSANSSQDIPSEFIYCNLSINSDTEYKINVGNINGDSSFNNIIGKSGNLYELKPFAELNFPVSYDAFSNYKITEIGKSHTNEGESLYKIFGDSNLGNYRDSEIYFGNTYVDNYIYDYNMHLNVLISGKNNYGQLGLGDTTDRTTSTKIEYYQENNNSGTLFSLDNIFIKQFIQNEYNIYLLDYDGNIYSCGRNDYGRLGLGDTTNRNRLTKIDIFQDINDETIQKPIINFIACSPQNLYGIDTEGNFYTCGSRINLGLGVLNTGKNRLTRMEIFQDENENVIEKPFIISISTLKDIQNTVSLLDNKGNVYSFGTHTTKSSSSDELLIPTKINNEFYDVNVNSIDKPFITKISSGRINKSSQRTNLLLLDNLGNVYTTEYGIPNNPDLIGKPTKIEIFKDSTGEIPAVKIKDIYCGYYIAFLLDYEGNLYSFGENSGQLGHGDTTSRLYYPTKIETYHNSDGNVINDFVKINQVNITYNFSGTFLDTKGNIYVTGINYYYQFGNGVSQSQQYNTPTKLDNFSNIISTSYGSYLEVTNLTPKYTSNSDTIGTVIIKYTSKYNHVNYINNELKSIVIDLLLSDDNDRYIQFNYDSSIISYTIEFPEEYSNFNVDLLVVGGGGGGGYGSNISGAGGGSVGGILYGSNLELHKNREYKITIGNGGLGGIDGEDSKFYLDDANFALARGGGKGGSYDSPPGQGGGGSGNYPESGSINIYNSNIGDFSTLNSYQNKGNNADFTLIFTVLDFSGFNGTQEDLHTNGTVSIKRFKFDDSERVIISSGNDNRADISYPLQPGIEASDHTFVWEDDYDLAYQRDRTLTSYFSSTWGMHLDYLIPTTYNYNLNGTTYNKHFYLCRTNTAIELTTIAFVTFDRNIKHFKIFGTNFNTSDITLDNIATNNWVELVEIESTNMNHIVACNKNNTFTMYRTNSNNINGYFQTYNWTDTTDRFNTFLFMVIDNNSTIKYLNVVEIAFRGKTINGSIGGDGSSSDLIYHSLSFEGGIGKSNYHINSVTNANDNTGNGGSGNGGKGGSGTVIIKYIPKYNYKLELENEITPVSLDEYHNYILFNINYDINNYKIKFPEEYGTFNADVLVVSGNSLDNNGCNIGGGEVIYSNIELSSNIEYNINIGKNNIFKGNKSEFYNITAYGIQSNSNINIDTFGFINDNNLKITIDNNIYLENYSYEKYQTNDGISLYSIFPDSNLGYYNNSKIYFGISDYLGKVNNIPVNYSVNKSMYVYGDNNYGQLGLGSTVDWQDTQTELKYFKDNNINIVKIFSHKNRSALNNNFFIDNNGTVYACGYNSYGQLGIGSSDNKNIPTKISVFKNENNEEIIKPIIIKIVNSDYATLFLDNNGNVYGCGNHNYAFREKLSHVNFKTYPTLLSPEINNIIDIAFTDNGFLLLNNNGIVYAIGGNSARMGLGSNTTNTYFVNSITDHEIKVFLRKDETEIIQRPYITKIYGYYNTVFLIDNNGDVYACGSNSDGQMGIGSDTSVIYNPRKIEEIFTDKIIDISLNDISTLFLDNNGDVYGCGKNTLYWLGIGGISAKNDPVKIEVFRDENNGTIEKPKIVKVVMPVSKYNNNYNSVAFFHDNNGNVYVSGYNVYNYYKNLVKYDMAYTQQPIKTNLRNIIDIETGVFIQYDSMVLNDTISSNPVVLVKYKNSRMDIISSFSSEINYSTYNNIYPLLSNNNLVTNITNKNTSIDINLDNDLFTILIKIQIKTSERYRIFNIKNIFIEINENNIYIYDNNSDLIEDISNLNIKFKWIDICITYSNNNLILYLGLEGKIVKIIETTKTLDNTIDNLVILNNSDFIFEDYSILCEDIKVYSSILSIDKIQKYIFGNKSLYLT